MNRRRRAERRGRIAEILAAIYLMFKGYRLIAWRVRTPRGEIDLILSHRKHIVFVEVKTRREIDAGLQSVNVVKARRTVDAARMWIGRNAGLLDVAYRFDIVVFAANHWPRHIVNAYGADPY